MLPGQEQVQLLDVGFIVLDFYRIIAVKTGGAKVIPVIVENGQQFFNADIVNRIGV